MTSKEQAMKYFNSHPERNREYMQEAREARGDEE